jgi:hypothetical protein
MIGSVVSIVSMMAGLSGIIGFIDSTDSTDSTTSTMSSLSATSVFHGGGVGAGVLGGAGAGVTRTGTTAGTVPVMDTVTAVGPESPNYSAGSPAPVITMALSTEL